MKTNQHTAEQIIKILEQADKGDQTIGAICRTHSISENTFYRWRKIYGGMSVAEVQRLKDLEKENARLKRLHARTYARSRCAQRVAGKKSMSVAQRRDAVRFLVDYGLSVVRACVLVQLQRATFLYQSRCDADTALLEEVSELAHAQPRYGYQRIWAVLRRTRKINRKRVHRLWKQANLQVKRVSRRRARRERPAALAAAYPNHIWAYDFLFDHDAHGRKFHILTVMDEFTREALALDVESSTSAERVITVLKQLVTSSGAPDYLRSDNGAEFIALAVQAWLAQQQIRTLYIDPGCPWQNGKDERLNGTVRDECLNLQLFASVNEARIRLETFRQHYNHDRPHSRLGYQTPAAFKQAWNEAQAKSEDSHIPT